MAQKMVSQPIEEVHALLELDGQRVQGQEDEFVL